MKCIQIIPMKKTKTEKIVFVQRFFFCLSNFEMNFWQKGKKKQINSNDADLLRVLRACFRREKVMCKNINPSK